MWSFQEMQGKINTFRETDERFKRNMKKIREGSDIPGGLEVS